MPFTSHLYARVKETLARVDGGLYLIGVLPLLLGLITDEWVYADAWADASAGWKDSWVYTGYMLNLPGHLQTFPGTYYGSRLAWLVPGYLAHHLLHPLAANLILRLGLFYASAFSLYFILKETVRSRPAALLATIFMATYTYFLAAIGWDYIDGVGQAYWLLSIAMLTRGARRPNSWVWFFAAGALYAAMLHSNLFLATFTPFLVWYYLLIVPKGKMEPILSSGATFMLGSIALTLLLAAINVTIGGRFWFFMPSVRMLLWFSQRPNPWKAQSYSWILHARWLVLPAVAAVGAATLLFDRRTGIRAENYRVARQLQLHFLSIVVFMIGWEALGQPVLQLHYYASFLLPAMFLALGAQFSALIDGLKVNQVRLVICFAVAAWLVPLLLRSPGPRAWPNGSYMMLAIGLLLAGLFALILVGPRVGPVLLLCACLAACNWIVRGPRAILTSEMPTRKDGFLAVVKAFWIVQSWEPRGRLLFWYDRKETAERPGLALGNLYRAIASTYLWGYRLINEDFPSLERNWVGGPPVIEAGSRIVLLSRAGDAVERASEALKRRGFKARVGDVLEIQVGHAVFRMILLEDGRVRTGRPMLTPRFLCYRHPLEVGMSGLDEDQLVLRAKYRTEVKSVQWMSDSSAGQSQLVQGCPWFPEIREGLLA